MPDYRVVKYATRLKSQPLIETDAPALPVGTGQVAVGMGGEGEPAQLDIIYNADDRTIVYPYKGPDGLGPWALKGAISPDDCVAWCRANVANQGEEQ